MAALLDAVPDLRQALKEADETALIEIFNAFDVTATYTKDTCRLELTATVAAQPIDDEATATLGRSRDL